ncbi:hypothetical protein FSP39_012923 [Pinctada imbricata]|uniref:Uncharacterized protein n=1 Tax=Pinctada imbricata TaxID=66713 RepID=A0AA89C8U6_PINIB|nr:hypothetical protein FSP39_012923 [Pinctada imbricata]
MFLYENSGKLVRSMNVDVDINDMAVASSGDLVVTCGDMKVRHLTVRGWSTTLINTAPYEPDGICLTDKEEIVVCMRGQDNGKHIAVFSDDGQDRLHEISGRDSQAEELSLTLTVLFKTVRIYVLEGGLIQLIMTQEQTRLLDPLGICVDDETGQVWLGNYSGDVVIAEYLK